MNQYNSMIEKDKQYILSESNLDMRYTDKIEKNITVIIVLYYLESVEHFVRYIREIPDWFKIEIYSSRKEVLDKVHELNCFRTEQKLKLLLKENRGRDISTLLVAAKESVLESDYICFIHDKKENASYLKSDTEIWTYNLWENMLGTQIYIENIISLLNKEEDLGILFPPEPIGEFLFHWYGECWLDNFENSKYLAEKLGLSVDILRQQPPIGLGSVFWAKSRALKKVFNYTWKYEDFPEEPMGVDGTINHAIERIFGYVAEDGGYRQGTVMTTSYASWLIQVAQKYSKEMFAQLSKREHVFNMYQIFDLDNREKKIIEFSKNKKRIAIYGAGNYGKNLYLFLKDRGISVCMFIVSDMRGADDYIDDVPIKTIHEAAKDEELGIIIGVSYETLESIERMLRDFNISDYIYGY